MIVLIYENVDKHAEGGVGSGGVLDRYLGIGEPLKVWNPEPV